MTGNLIQLMIPGMTKPGRRPSTSSEWKLAFIRRVVAAREKFTDSQAKMAAELERVNGLTVSYDTYRKYEILDAKKGALLRNDLIVAFCEITRTHVSELLEGSPFVGATQATTRRRNAA